MKGSWNQAKCRFSNAVIAIVLKMLQKMKSVTSVFTGEFHSSMVEMRNLVEKPGPSPWECEEKSQEEAKEDETFSMQLHEDLLQ